MNLKWKLLILFLLFAGTVGYLFGQPHISQPADTGRELFTPVTPWVLLRTPATEDAAAATDLTATYPSFYDIVAGGNTSAAAIKTNIDDTNGVIDVLADLGWGVNAVEIAFFTTSDAANDTFDFELWAWRDNSLYGPGKLVYKTTSAANAVGTADCTRHPITGATQSSGLWADTISGTDYWPTGVTVTDSGTNQIAIVTFDLMGYRYLRCLVYNAGGTSTECAAVGAIISGF